MRFLLAVTLIVLVLAVASCGDDDDAQPPVPRAPTSAGPEAAGPARDAPKSVFEVTLVDNAFELNTFAVPAGAAVEFELTSIGGNLHNMRIAGPDGDFETEDDTLSDPDTIGNGVIVSVPWAAPDEPGDIPFRCDFHPAEMTGTVTVE
jgi:plastocyanin